MKGSPRSQSACKQLLIGKQTTGVAATCFARGRDTDSQNCVQRFIRDDTMCNTRLEGGPDVPCAAIHDRRQRAQRFRRPPAEAYAPLKRF
jgi:hypothetical protein